MGPDLINAILNNPVEKVAILLLVGLLIWVGKWLRSEITTNRNLVQQQAKDLIDTFKEVNSMLDNNATRVDTRMREMTYDIKNHMDSLSNRGQLNPPAPRHRENER